MHSSHWFLNEAPVSDYSKQRNRKNILDVKRGFIFPHCLNKIIHEGEVRVEAEVRDIANNRASSSYCTSSSILKYGDFVILFMTFTHKRKSTILSELQ